MTRGKQLVISGASGYVGRALCRIIDEDRALPLYGKNHIPGGLPYDALNQDLASVITDAQGIGHCVILHAWTNVDRCARFPDDAYRINVTSSINIIDWCAANGIIPVFASSEAVFGSDGDLPADENTSPRPYTLYGRMKMEVEDYIRATNIPHVIVRLARVFGDSASDHTGFENWFQSFRRGSVIRCAKDQILSPISISDAARGLLLAVENNLRGTYHLAGDGPISRLDLLRLIIEEYQKKYPGEIPVEECLLADFDVVERRPLNSSMAILKFSTATGFQPVSYSNWCRNLVAEA